LDYESDTRYTNPETIAVIGLNIVILVYLVKFKSKLRKFEKNVDDKSKNPVFSYNTVPDTVYGSSLTPNTIEAVKYSPIYSKNHFSQGTLPEGKLYNIKYTQIFPKTICDFIHSPKGIITLYSIYFVVELIQFSFYLVGCLNEWRTFQKLPLSTSEDFFNACGRIYTIDYPSFWLRLVFITMVLVAIARRKPGYLVPMQIWSCMQVFINVADTIDYSMLCFKGSGSTILTRLSENWFPVVDGSQLYFYNVGYYSEVLIKINAGDGLTGENRM